MYQSEEVVQTTENVYDVTGTFSLFQNFICYTHIPLIIPMVLPRCAATISCGKCVFCTSKKDLNPKSNSDRIVSLQKSS